MSKKLKSILLALSAGFVIAAPLAVTSATFAAAPPTYQNTLCNGTVFNADPNATNSCTTGNGQNGVNQLLATIINYFSIFVGVVAVVMIIVGGLRYITSGGESGKVSSAKTTIIYALIGLVVVALAQLIVHFVLTASYNLGNQF